MNCCLTFFLPSKRSRGGRHKRVIENVRWGVVAAAVMADPMGVVAPRDPMVTPSSSSTSSHGGGPGDDRVLVLGRCRDALRTVLSVSALRPSVRPHLIIFTVMHFTTIQKQYQASCLLQFKILAASLGYLEKSVERFLWMFFFKKEEAGLVINSIFSVSFFVKNH